MARQQNRPIIRKALAALERKAQERCYEIADFIVLEIATNPKTPHDTGRLSLSYEVRDDGHGNPVIVSTAPYWAFVEYGTRTHVAQPHLNPAVELVRSWYT